MAKVRRDKPFYDASGGGVTFSGGEATQSMAFLGELAKRRGDEDPQTLVGSSNAPTSHRVSVRDSRTPQTENDAHVPSCV